VNTRTIEVVLGGDVDPGAKFVSPTIVRAKPASKVMQDEIFGPILPVLSYISLADAISYVNEHDKPLALYLFSDDKCVLSGRPAWLSDVATHCV
jgi:aldehyde dehydrogenase (NAD+)